MATENETTALIIEHVVKTSEIERYEVWLKQVLDVMQHSPGYLGREVFKPVAEGKPYVIIDRFSSHENLLKWLYSTERKNFVEAMQDALETGDQTTVKAGIDVWFTPDNTPRRPAPYKQFLITAMAIYPLALLIPRLFAPLFQAVPFLAHPLVSGLIVTSVLVGLMTYVIMPFLNRRLHNWLFKA